MTVIRIKGDKAKYDVRSKDCIGLPCLKLHAVSIRSAMSSGGSRLAGYRHCCARREYENCPQPIPEFDKALAAQRRKEGYKNA